MSRIFGMGSIMNNLNDQHANEVDPTKRSLLDSFLYNHKGSDSMTKAYFPRPQQPSFLNIMQQSSYESGVPANPLLQQILHKNQESPMHFNASFLKPANG
jgi:hypothetical protein